MFYTELFYFFQPISTVIRVIPPLLFCPFINISKTAGATTVHLRFFLNDFSTFLARIAFMKGAVYYVPFMGKDSKTTEC